MKWANVSNIYDIPEDSAKAFINECVKGLGPKHQKDEHQQFLAG